MTPTPHTDTSHTMQGTHDTHDPAPTHADPADTAARTCDTCAHYGSNPAYPSLHRHCLRGEPPWPLQLPGTRACPQWTLHTCSTCLYRCQWTGLCSADGTDADTDRPSCGNYEPLDD